MTDYIFSFLIFGFAHSLDPDRIVSVHYENEKFRMSPGLSKDVNVVAWANFTNDQATNGWMNLEITTSESFSDHIQVHGLLIESIMLDNMIFIRQRLLAMLKAI